MSSYRKNMQMAGYPGKVALVVGLLLLTNLARAEGPETFGIPWDRALHFSAGYIGADVVQVYLEKKHVPRPWPCMAGISTALTLGALKEAYDSQQPGNRWDWGDFAATYIGGMASITIHFGPGK